MFQEVAVVPEDHPVRHSGEIALLAGVLEDDLLILSGRPTATSAEIEEARRWVEEGNRGRFTFAFTAEMCGLNPPAGQMPPPPRRRTWHGRCAV